LILKHGLSRIHRRTFKYSWTKVSLEKF
jgi:hypothetical protein